MTTITDMATIDMRGIVYQLEDVIDLLEKVDGKNISDVDASTKIKAAAEISRELLFIEHLLDKARVDVMAQYHEMRRDRNR